MKSWLSCCLFLLFAGSALCVKLGAAQSTDDLPSAPSAVSHPKATRPKPPSPPPPEEQPAVPSVSDTAPKPSPPTEANTDREAPRGAGTDQGGTTIYSTVNEVSVVFTVTDKHNHYVKDLGRSDFRVVDDERPVENIRSFRRETDLPLLVGLLIDASNSIRDRFKFEQESAIEFLNQTIRRNYDTAFVVGFDVEAELTQDFTDDTESLAKGVRMLKPGGGTALFDALYFACRDKLLKSSRNGSEIRRAIILVSDGEDNSSHVTREEAIDMALRANVIVYTISTNFPGGGPGDKVLGRIADATGGRAFQPFQLSEVANSFAEIQDDLRSQYALSYSPPNFAHDGRFRTIAITALHKGLKVRSRNGYYAPGQ